MSGNGPHMRSSRNNTFQTLQQECPPQLRRSPRTHGCGLAGKKRSSLYLSAVGIHSASTFRGSGPLGVVCGLLSTEKQRACTLVWWLEIWSQLSAPPRAGDPGWSLPYGYLWVSPNKYLISLNFGLSWTHSPTLTLVLQLNRSYNSLLFV